MTPGRLSRLNSQATGAVMPPARRAPNQTPSVDTPTVTVSPVERLLKINEDILRAKTVLGREVLMRRVFGWGLVICPAGLLALVISTKITWRVVDLGFYNLTIAPFLLVGSATAIAFFVKMTDERRPASIKLNLALLQERKQLQAGDLHLDARYRRSSYRDEVPDAIARLRRESRFYRRVHNALQGIIIVGSLVTSTITGLSVTEGQFRIAAVITSSAVGIAAGFTGYFKFRERGFYLQQTADAIEQEYQEDYSRGSYIS
jgi:hypothetical protein